MKKLFIVSFILISYVGQIVATRQVPDVLYYGKEKLTTSISIPGELYDTYNPTVKLFGKKQNSNTACGNGYISEWRIIDDQLYLTNIYSCNYENDSIKADLKRLFKDKYQDGKVKADWVSTSVLAKRGKFVGYIDIISIYEKEIEFFCKNGKIIEIKEYDNSKSKTSKYTDNRVLTDFIQREINWNSIPKLDKPIRVDIKFTGNENGKIDSVEVIKGNTEFFNQEAVRVVKAIPEWSVFFSRGKHIKSYWIIPVVFSEENRLKYSK